MKKNPNLIRSCETENRPAQPKMDADVEIDTASHMTQKMKQSHQEEESS